MNKYFDKKGMNLGKMHFNPFLFHTCIILLFSYNIYGQDLRAFYIGHSLSDGVIDMVNSLSSHDKEVGLEFRYQTIPGSPLRWNWQAKDRNDYPVNDPFYCGFYHPEKGLPSGQFDVLVLTESVPRYASIIEETYSYADSFYQYAIQYQPNIRIFIYEVWHCIKSNTPNPCDWDKPAPPWRERLVADLPMWEGVVDHLNQKFQPKHPVCMIPAGQALGVLSDAIHRGEVPGITKMEDLFSDDIHLNDMGKYFVACVHFSMLHHQSPEGLPAQLYNMWGKAYNAPTNEQAAVFQKIAWNAANSYPNSCLAVINVDKDVYSGDDDTLYPNPAEDWIYIRGTKNWELLDFCGRIITRGDQDKMDISNLTPGMYLFRFDKGVKKLFVK